MGNLHGGEKYLKKKLSVKSLSFTVK